MFSFFSHLFLAFCAFVFILLFSFYTFQTFSAFLPYFFTRVLLSFIPYFHLPITAHSRHFCLLSIFPTFRLFCCTSHLFSFPLFPLKCLPCFSPVLRPSSMQPACRSVLTGLSSSDITPSLWAVRISSTPPAGRWRGKRRRAESDLAPPAGAPSLQAPPASSGTPTHPTPAFTGVSLREGSRATPSTSPSLVLHTTPETSVYCKAASSSALKRHLIGQTSSESTSFTSPEEFPILWSYNICGTDSSCVTMLLH